VMSRELKPFTFPSPISAYISYARTPYE
jgi:hypothetical protein